VPIRRHHLRNKAVSNVKVEPETLTYNRLAKATVVFAPEWPLLAGGAQSVPADAVAVKNVEHTLNWIEDAAVKHWARGALIVDYTWAATADGTIQLYDETNAVVLGETPVKTGGEVVERDAFDISKPATPCWVRVRVNITVAGAAGETVTIYRAKVRTIAEVS